MTELYSVNYNKAYATANGIVPRGDHGGRVKFMYDEYTLPAVVLAENDEILLGKLPPFARVVEAEISCASLGTTGKLSMGHKASIQFDADDTVITEDADAFVDEADAGGQAVTEMMTANANLAGNLLQFGNQETQVFAKCTESSTNTDVKIKFGIWYIVD